MQLQGKEQLPTFHEKKYVQKWVHRQRWSIKSKMSTQDPNTLNWCNGTTEVTHFRTDRQESAVVIGVSDVLRILRNRRESSRKCKRREKHRKRKIKNYKREIKNRRLTVVAPFGKCFSLCAALYSPTEELRQKPGNPFSPHSPAWTHSIPYQLPDMHARGRTPSS